jgi:hypothetical protein
VVKDFFEKKKIPVGSKSRNRPGERRREKGDGVKR